MKYLAIFDIDGTLTETVGIDDKVFRYTLKKLFSIEIDDIEWEEAKLESTATDAGLFKTIFDKYIIDGDFMHELIKFKTAFTHYLRFELLQQRNDIKEVNGAKFILNELMKDNDVTISIATGSWKYAGLLKLQATNITPNMKTYSNSDNFFDRKHIIEEAIKISKINNKDFNKITYFGDGLWDKLSAESLGINFIGVDHKNNGILSNCHNIVINNFNDYYQIRNFITN